MSFSNLYVFHITKCFITRTCGARSVLVVVTKKLNKFINVISSFLIVVLITRCVATRASQLYGTFASEMSLGDAAMWCCTSPGCTHR